MTDKSQPVHEENIAAEMEAKADLEMPVPLNSPPVNDGKEEDAATVPEEVEPESSNELEEALAAIGETIPLPPIAADARPVLSPSQIRDEGEDEEPYLLCARRSHPGVVRGRNQDSCIAFTAQTGGHNALPLFGLYIVADGMGGHLNGDIAGRIASRMVADHILQEIYWPLLHGDTLASQQPIPEVLEEAAQRANSAIRLPDQDREMGTTLTTALILGRRLYMLHVGDSRAYLFHEDNLEQVTTDHSVVKALEDAGQLTAEEAAQHPSRNLLYRALMGQELDVDSFSRLLPQTGKLMLCTDGLWGLLKQEDIQGILANGEPLQKQAEALVQKALKAGGYDNISVILVEFGV